jgi:hypothetical protein
VVAGHRVLPDFRGPELKVVDRHLPDPTKIQIIRRDRKNNSQAADVNISTDQINSADFQFGNQYLFSTWPGFANLLKH